MNLLSLLYSDHEVVQELTNIHNDTISRKQIRPGHITHKPYAQTPKKRFENNFAPTIQLSMISDDSNLNKKNRSKESMDIWACFGYHPVILGAICKGFQKIRNCPYKRFLLEDAVGETTPKVGISWYNVLPRLDAIIAKITKMIEIYSYIYAFF